MFSLSSTCKPDPLLTPRPHCPTDRRPAETPFCKGLPVPAPSFESLPFLWVPCEGFCFWGPASSLGWPLFCLCWVPRFARVLYRGSSSIAPGPPTPGSPKMTQERFSHRQTHLPGRGSERGGGVPQRWALSTDGEPHMPIPGRDIAQAYTDINLSTPMMYPFLSQPVPSEGARVQTTRGAVSHRFGTELYRCLHKAGGCTDYWAPLTHKRHAPQPAQPRHTNYWAPRTRKRHQQEHRLQRPTERSDRTQHAKGRTGDCPGPRKGATTRRNVTQGGGKERPCEG